MRSPMTVIMASVVCRCFRLCKRIPEYSKIRFEINHHFSTSCRRYWCGSSVSFMQRISRRLSASKQSVVIASAGFGVISAFRLVAFCYVDQDATNCEFRFYWHLGTNAGFGPTSILPLFITKFVYIGYLTQTLILKKTNQHSQIYLCFTNIAFWDPNRTPIWASRKRSDACHCAMHVEWAISSLFMPIKLKSLLRCAVYKTDMRKMMLNDWINKIKFQMLAQL